MESLIQLTVLLNILVTWCSTSDVTVTCPSCTNTTSTQFDGQPGATLHITYAINNEDFVRLKVSYNGTQNIIDIAPSTFTTRLVKDTRISMSKVGGEQTYRVQLTTLRKEDDGMLWSWEYKNKFLKTFTGENLVKLNENKKGDSREIKEEEKPTNGGVEGRASLA